MSEVKTRIARLERALNPDGGDDWPPKPIKGYIGVSPDDWDDLPDDRTPEQKGYRVFTADDWDEMTAADDG